MESISRRIWYAAITAMIIQQVWIGGGYATGREIVEYIAKYGALGGASILISATMLIIALIPTLEIARVFKAYDYMTWAKQFLWRFWPVLDIVYIIMAWIVIAVIGAAAAAVLEDFAGVPFIVGAALTMIVVGVLHFFGRRAIESFWIAGTIGLLVMYIVIWLLALSARGGVALENISRGLSIGSPRDALIDGFRYTMYNLLAVLPALQSVDRYRGRLESIVATVLATLLIYGTATVIWISFMGFYPEIISEPVPWSAVLKAINAPAWAIGLYVFWLFYALLTTAVGAVYAIILRMKTQLEQHGWRLSKTHEAILSIVILAVSIITAQAGIIALVARGYGTMAWAFFAVYFIPLITIGIVRLARPEWRRELWIKA